MSDYCIRRKSAWLAVAQLYNFVPMAKSRTLNPFAKGILHFPGHSLGISKKDPYLVTFKETGGENDERQDFSGLAQTQLHVK